MKTKLRATKIIIETPAEGLEIWVHVYIEKRVYEDDMTTLISSTGHDKYMHRAVSGFIGDIFKYYDPEVSPSIEKSISGIGLNMAISSAIMNWMLEEFKTEKIGGYVWLL